jgi:structural maintenance of chromosome 2
MAIFICLILLPRFFGEPGTPYDYQNISLADVRKQLQQLGANHESMRKKINARVMNMIDK